MQTPANQFYGIVELKVCSAAGPVSKQTAAVEAVAAPIPENLSLEQNYPNPFNPTTNINFGLPEAAQVSLKIYNIVGEEVATLVNERRTAGNHSVVFDASQMPSGVYFSVLNVGEVKLVRRLVLMK
jgi:hypothetical protein